MIHGTQFHNDKQITVHNEFLPSWLTDLKKENQILLF